MTLLEIGSFNIYMGILVNAVFTGIGMGCGIAIGTYISQNHILKFPKKIRRRIKKWKKQ